MDKIRKLHLVFLFCACFLTDITMAGYIQGKGRFYAADKDSASFIKRQLLSAAFRDVITKSIAEMGLDANVFWERVDSKFEISFAPVAERLRKRYGVGEPGKKISGKKLKDYQNVLRAKRLSQKGQFGRLNEMIEKYSIIKMSRSPQVPNARFIRLQAVVDRKLLKEKYFHFGRTSQTREFANLYIEPVFIYQGGEDQSELRTDEKNLETVVLSHWKKWFGSRERTISKSIILVEDELKNEISNFLRTKSSQAESNPGAGIENNFSSLSNSLLLKIRIYLDKVLEDKVFKTKSYKIHGDLIFVDLKSRQPIFSKDFMIAEKKYMAKDSSDFFSALASDIYSLPLSGFSVFSTESKKVVNRSKFIEIRVSNIDSILEVSELKKIIMEKGVAREVSIELANLNLTESKLRLYYSGHLEKILDVLKDTAGVKLSSSSKMISVDAMNLLELKLEKVAMLEEVSKEKKK